VNINIILPVSNRSGSGVIINHDTDHKFSPIFITDIIYKINLDRDG